ncbi:MAG: hypothetical protein HY763_13780 [Planctomycetes bacterium]|nr:hypothetical protein [Planctomycetota bacterium]
MQAAGFSLVELLTVMFIITLLIGILIPSLNSARNTAKKTHTRSTLQTLKVGLDLFKNENEKDFRATNGYPPSYVHPPIAKSDGSYAFGTNEGLEGRFPFGVAPGFDKPRKPRVFGAHWLPAMLSGADNRGYVARGSVPKKDKINEEPWRWYHPDPLGEGKSLERRPLYADLTTVTVPTERVLGKPNAKLFPEWDEMKQLPVVVDAFDQPILYYAANASGKQSNIVADKRNPTNTYAGGVQETGPPMYVHEDNHAFTGDEVDEGWDFGGGFHDIQHAGEKLDADSLARPLDRDLRPGTPNYVQPTFAHFILDPALRRTFQTKLDAGEKIDPKTPLQAANHDSYLLISAGVDGRYGTPDDITNFPLSTE